MASSDDTPASMGGLLRKAFRSWNMAPRIAEVDLRRRWEEVVGPKLAAHVHVESLKRGELTVIVPSGLWAQELQAMQVELLNQIRERLRSPAVQTLRVRIARLPKPAVMKPPPVRLPAPEELPEQTRARLASIEDPDVRSALTEFARWASREKAD